MRTLNLIVLIACLVASCGSETPPAAPPLHVALATPTPTPTPATSTTPACDPLVTNSGMWVCFSNCGSDFGIFNVITLSAPPSYAPALELQWCSAAFDLRGNVASLACPRGYATEANAILDGRLGFGNPDRGEWSANFSAEYLCTQIKIDGVLFDFVPN